MGLDICIYEEIKSKRVGAYSMFHSFRQSLIILIKTPNWIGSINKTEPFYELLNHSDCDDTLEYSDCLELKKDFDEWYNKAENYAIKYGDYNFLTIYELFMNFITIVLEEKEGVRFIQFC